MRVAKFFLSQIPILIWCTSGLDEPDSYLNYRKVAGKGKLAMLER